MAGVQYKMRSGEPSRKLRFQASTGLPIGATLAVVIGYFIGRYDPAMPPEIVTALAGLCATGLTGGAMLLVGWVTRPGRGDDVIVDPATVPPNRVEPPPPPTE